MLQDIALEEASTIQFEVYGSTIVKGADLGMVSSETEKVKFMV